MNSCYKIGRAKQWCVALMTRTRRLIHSTYSQWRTNFSRFSQIKWCWRQELKSTSHSWWALHRTSQNIQVRIIVSRSISTLWWSQARRPLAVTFLTHKSAQESELLSSSWPRIQTWQDISTIHLSKQPQQASTAAKATTWRHIWPVSTDKLAM